MRSRTLYLPIESANAHMVLAEAVKDPYGRSLLPSGAELNEENIHQLIAHRVEFVCISIAETRSAEQIAIDAAETARRVLAVFDRADFSDPVMAALFNQVLTYRSA